MSFSGVEGVPQTLAEDAQRLLDNQQTYANPDQFLQDANGKPVVLDESRASRNQSYSGERATANFTAGLQGQSTVTDVMKDQQVQSILDARSGKHSIKIVPENPNPDEKKDNDNQEFTPKVKKQLFFACLFALLIGNMMLLNVASFLPSFIEQTDWENNATLQGFDTSLIIAIFSVAQIVFAPFNSMIKNAIGSKNTIVIGFFFLTVSTFALGWIAVIKNAETFKYVAVVVRFFQGLGDILLQVTSYTVITTVFSDNVMKYISYIEITVGLGLGLGPALGSVIDTQVGYEWTMYIFGFLNLIGMILCMFFIPKELNNTPKEDSDTDVVQIEDVIMDDQNEEDKKKAKGKITWCKILQNKHFTWALIACFFGTTNLVYFQGYIAPYFGQFDFDEESVGYVMALQQVTYLPMCLILPHFCETAFPRKLQFVIAMFGFAISCFMMGPSLLLDFPQNYWIIIGAFPMMGIFQYFVFIPIIPEMLERVTVDLNAVEGEDPELDAAIYDKVNDAYGFVYALAMFIGPLVGGYMHDTIGGRKTADWIAISNLVVGTIMFLLNCGPFVFQENRQFFAKLNILKEKAEKLAEEEEDEEEDQDTSINQEAPNVFSKQLFKSMIRDDKDNSFNAPSRARVPHLNYYNGKNRSQTLIQVKERRRQEMQQRKNTVILQGGAMDGLSYDAKSTGGVSARTFDPPYKR